MCSLVVSEVCSLWIPSRHIGGFIRWRVWRVGAELEQPQAKGRELGFGERVRLGDGIAHGQHEPIGGGVQDEPHLVGERRTAAGAVGGELWPCAS